MKKYYWLIFLALILVAAVFGLKTIKKQKSSSQLKQLAAVEVNDYQGAKLSSIQDFRENSIKGPQQVDKESYRLLISGLVDQERQYGYDEVINSFSSQEKVVTLYCVEGWQVTILWQGILLKDLFDQAGVKPQANTVIFHAVDGYTTSLPLSYILENQIILAYKMNGLTLPAERGFPFQLVAESKLGYKWIKWLNQIELSDDPGYQGYWESRGYDHQVDVD